MSQSSQDQRLNEYYELNVKHLRWSFVASLGALLIGLAAILSGVFLLFFGAAGAAPQLTTLGGVFSQFIGAGFFFLYSRNLKQLNVFYEKLIKHQDTMFAVSLLGHLPENARVSSIETVIATLLTRNEPKVPMDPETARVIAQAMQARREQS